MSSTKKLWASMVAKGPDWATCAWMVTDRVQRYWSGTSPVTVIAPALTVYPGGVVFRHPPVGSYAGMILVIPTTPSVSQLGSFLFRSLSAWAPRAARYVSSADSLALTT